MSLLPVLTLCGMFLSYCALYVGRVVKQRVRYFMAWFTAGGGSAITFANHLSSNHGLIYWFCIYTGAVQICAAYICFMFMLFEGMFDKASR